MSTVWHWLGLLLLVVSGCRTSAPDLKPPPQPDDYSLPPESDGRYNKPYQPTRDPFSTTPDKRSLTPGQPGGPGQPMLPARSPRTGYGPGSY